jgi:hypothetical protein
MGCDIAEMCLLSKWQPDLLQVEEVHRTSGVASICGQLQHA